MAWLPKKTTVSNGTVSNAPDTSWRYVVEEPDKDNPQGDPNGKWVYRQSPYDTLFEAESAIKSVKGPVRIRSFRLQHMPMDYGIDPSVFTSKPLSTDLEQVPMQEWQCIDHQSERISVPESARAPRCPVCRTTMHKPAFVAALTKMEAPK